MAKLVIFTDLDGTLLSEGSHDFDLAREALDRIRRLGIPMIFATAKTQTEVLEIQNRLQVRAPFITENGSAVFIPKDCFPFDFQSDRGTPSHWVIELGVPYGELRRFLAELPPIQGLKVRGFGDMGIEEVCAITGLDPAAAARAMCREYDETLILEGKPGAVGAFTEMAGRRGFRVTHGGTFHHLLGRVDKGIAALILSSLFAKHHGRIVTAAIGNAQNDLPLLSAVNIPVLLGKKIRLSDGFKSPGRLLPHHAKSWAQAIDHILREATEADRL